MKIMKRVKKEPRSVVPSINKWYYKTTLNPICALSFLYAEISPL